MLSNWIYIDFPLNTRILIIDVEFTEAIKLNIYEELV